MTPTFFSNQSNDIPFRNEVGFEFKGKPFKVHVHEVTEGNDIVYKLFFKNNIENTNKSIMKLVRSSDPDGKTSWTCKADYFAVMDNEMAAIAGAAIEKVLDKK